MASYIVQISCIHPSSSSPSKQLPATISPDPGSVYLRDVLNCLVKGLTETSMPSSLAENGYHFCEIQPTGKVMIDLEDSEKMRKEDREEEKESV